jgi:hypothetical protein
MDVITVLFKTWNPPAMPGRWLSDIFIPLRAVLGMSVRVFPGYPGPRANHGPYENINDYIDTEVSN